MENVSAFHGTGEVSIFIYFFLAAICINWILELIKCYSKSFIRESSSDKMILCQLN